MIYILLVHIICGVLGYGFIFSYNQHEYPLSAKVEYKKDLSIAILFFVVGIIGLICLLTFSLIDKDSYFKHGLKFK